MSGGIFQVGDVLAGTYRIERPLGAGGMGAVYIASHVRLPKRYAIKTLHSQIGKDPQDAARFRQEAEIASRLHHPHIVEVHDFNTTDDGTNYIVMELLEGRDLAQLLDREKKLPPERVLSIVRDVVDALGAAHARGVVHRDLKPTNIFLNEVAGREVVKILDFGISKQAGSKEVRTLTSELIGTPAYMSPEQARGRNQDVDGRSDQFSLAAIVYEMLGGKRAFGESDDSVFDVLERVVHQDPPPLAGVAPAVQAVLSRGLSKTRDARFPDVTAFFRALAEAMGSDAGLRFATPPPAASTPPVRIPGPTSASATGQLIPAGSSDPPQRKRGPLIALAVGAVAAASAAAVLWIGPATSGDPHTKLEVAAPADLATPRPVTPPPPPAPPPDAAVAPPATPPPATPPPTVTPPAKKPPAAGKAKHPPRPGGGGGKGGNDDLEEVPFNKK